MSQPNELTPAAQRALVALRVLNPSAEQAAFLLEGYAGRAELADADVAAVLDAYRAALRLIATSNRMELRDDAGALVAVARRTHGPDDVWIVREQGSADVQWITGEMAVRAAMLAIGAGA